MDEIVLQHIASLNPIYSMHLLVGREDVGISLSTFETSSNPCSID